MQLVYFNFDFEILKGVEKNAEIGYIRHVVPEF